jgi:lysophospholipase L1-like esterase
MPKLVIEDGQTLLPIGDSITDAGRRFEAAPYGTGYVSLLIEMVAARWPGADIRYINKGIGGNRVTDLRDRWQDDVMRHRPDWLSVMIGINDLHSSLRGAPDGVDPALYREKYDSILEDAAQAFAPQIVLLEPFYMSTDTSGNSFRSRVLELIPEYISVVRDMADKYSARLVRTHEVFQKQLVYREPDVFCAEPVHPNRAGHLVIANALLEALIEKG